MYFFLLAEVFVVSSKLLLEPLFVVAGSASMETKDGNREACASWESIVSLGCIRWCFVNRVSCCASLPRNYRIAAPEKGKGCTAQQCVFCREGKIIYIKRFSLKWSYFTLITGDFGPTLYSYKQWQEVCNHPIWQYNKPHLRHINKITISKNIFLTVVIAVSHLICHLSGALQTISGKSQPFRGKIAGAVELDEGIPRWNPPARRDWVSCNSSDIFWNYPPVN